MLYADSKTRKLGWYANIVAHTLYAGFLIAKGIEIHYYDENATSQQKLFIEYSVGVYLLPVLFQTSVLIRTKEMVTFSNAHIKAFKHLQGKIQLQRMKYLTMSCAYMQNHFQVNLEVGMRNGLETCS